MSAATIAASALWCAGIYVGGLHVWPPQWVLVPVALIFAGLAIRKWRASRSSGTSRFPIASLAVAAALAGLGTVLLWAGLSGGTRPPGPSIALAPPLSAGEGYCALSAGSNALMNVHYVEGKSTAASFEKHSVDFVRLLPDGTRTLSGHRWNPKPLDPHSYAVFDAPVRAPCDGLVKVVEGDRPDNLAGHTYRRADGANRVELICGTTHIWLAHLKRGSVSVREGQRVAIGDRLGRVGNSGNTEEPHLHIHAQTLPDENMPGDLPRPVIMLFDDVYLTRGDCL